MFKKVSPIFVLVTILVFLLSSFMFSTVSAQEGAPDPNTPVSNVDGVMPVAKVAGNVTMFPSFAGTGKLAPEAFQLAGSHAVAPPVASYSPESVIVPDERTEITATTSAPSRFIAYLVVTWANYAQGACTGWFIGPRTVVTAGHCVYNTDAGAAHGWAKTIKVYPGRTGLSTPYASTSSYKLFSVKGWTDYAYPASDYGAIETVAPLGNNTGWFGYAWQASNTFAGTYTVRGYAGDKPAATMWTMSGAITNANTNRLWYSIDTFGGQSGAPLYNYVTGNGYTSYGVHTYGTSISPFYGNSATRITQSVFNNLTTWKASPYP